jgi:hypothetical protein
MVWKSKATSMPKRGVGQKPDDTGLPARLGTRYLVRRHHRGGLGWGNKVRT